MIPLEFMGYVPELQNTPSPWNSIFGRCQTAKNESVSIRVNPWLVFLACTLACLQNRLNELGQNYAIQIERW
jgi:hypothetical protein